MPVSLPNCRLCGARPKLHVNDEIVPGETSWAFNCSNPDCSNDTHWQNSLTQASMMWALNPCTNERGGQGNKDKDTIQ